MYRGAPSRTSVCTRIAGLTDLPTILPMHGPKQVLPRCPRSSARLRRWLLSCKRSDNAHMEQLRHATHSSEQHPWVCVAFGDDAAISREAPLPAQTFHQHRSIHSVSIRTR